MHSNSQSIWWPRLAAFLLAGLAAASAVYWGLKWPGTGASATASPVTSTDSPAPNPLALARAFGGNSNDPAAQKIAASSPSLGSRFALVGVVATGRQGGAALISVDGKPARPYRVGAQVDENLVLQSVGLRSAALAPAAHLPPNVRLELPPLKN